MRIGSLVLFAVLLAWATALAQQPELPSLSVAERNRWQADVISLFGEDWYFRLTVGALANIYPKQFQPAGFARLTLGLSWTPDWVITPQLRVTKAIHELRLSLEGVGDQPAWVLEITPFTFEFEINLRPSPTRAVSSRAQQPPAQPAQQVSLDLKALVLARIDELLKASEQMAKDRSVDINTLTKPLHEAKKAFEAGKTSDAGIQLDSYSLLLRALRKMGAFTTFTEYDETHLRTGLYRVVGALALFAEHIQKKPIKVCTGLFVREDQKAEEVISPLVTDVVKRISFTTPAGKEDFTLKESRCF